MRLEVLGPTYVKLGQILSLRQDILPDVVTSELRNLLSDLPPVPYEEIHSIVEADLGRPIEDIFAEVDPVPLGSASIGQVHRAVLRDSGEVDNDATLELYARVAIAQAEAGADVCAPSGMMDGQVFAIREALDDESLEHVVILSYGITSRVARATIQKARAEGYKVGDFRLITAWPFPEERIRELADQVKAFVVPEINLGQIAREVERCAAGRCATRHVPDRHQCRAFDHPGRRPVDTLPCDAASRSESRAHLAGCTLRRFHLTGSQPTDIRP